MYIAFCTFCRRFIIYKTKSFVSTLKQAFLDCFLSCVTRKNLKYIHINRKNPVKSENSECLERISRAHCSGITKFWCFQCPQSLTSTWLFWCCNINTCKTVSNLIQSAFGTHTQYFNPLWPQGHILKVFLRNKASLNWLFVSKFLFVYTYIRYFYLCSHHQNTSHFFVFISVLIRFSFRRFLS